MPSILAFIILLSTAAVAIRRGSLNQQICARISAAVCPDNTLDRQQYIDHVVTGELFIHIYGIEINLAPATYLKSYSIFSNEADSIHWAFNEDTGLCDNITSINVNVTDRSETLNGTCCKDAAGQPIQDTYVTLDFDGTALNGSYLQMRFFSQEPAKYFWTMFCIDATTETFEGCTYGFLDLFIPASQHVNLTTGELNLQGLPLKKIEEDLKFYSGVNMEDTGDPFVKWLWMGPDCPLP